MEQGYFVYIMTNAQKTVLYTGVTGDLFGRAYEHKSGKGGYFTSRYRVDRLVYAEAFEDIYDAIAREKQIKAGSRSRKVALIEEANPEWRDLSEA